MDELRDELAHLGEVAEGQNHSLKEWTKERLSRVTAQGKGLKNFATHVESFVHEWYSSQGDRASALEETHGRDEGEEGDGGRSRSVDQTAVASSSSTRPPACVHIPEPPRVSPPGIPIQHDYGAGVEVRSLLPTELVKEIDGKLAVTDVDSSGNRFVKFWIDDIPSSPVEEPTAPHKEEPVTSRSGTPFLPFPLLLKDMVNQRH